MYLVDKLSVSVVILQEWQEHLKSLGLIENYASLVVSQQGLQHCQDREETELLVLRLALSLSAHEVHEDPDRVLARYLHV
jgi:hypothetical protein